MKININLKQPVFKVNMLLIGLLFFISSAVMSQQVKFVINSNNNPEDIQLTLVRSSGMQDEFVNFSTKHNTIELTSLSFDKAEILSLNDSLLLVDANDSLSFKFDPSLKKYIITGGMYNDNYRVFYKLGADIDAKPFDSSQEDYTTYRNRIDNVYSRMVKRLDSIFNCRAMSRDVYSLCKEFIFYKNILSLLSPINSSNAKEYWPLLGEAWVYRTLERLKTPNFDNNRFYQLATLSFFVCRTYNDYNSKFEYHFYEKIIEENFPTDTKLKLLTSFFNDSSMPLLLEKDDLSAIYRQIIKLEQIPPDLKRKFKSHYEGYAIYGIPIPDSVQLSIKLRSTNRKSVLLKDILFNAERKKIVLDFWASWCVPCIKGLPNLKSFVEARGDIKIIYISLDENEENWKKGYEKHNISNNQYLLGGGFSSSLAKYLFLNSIPFYLYIDNDGKIIKLNHIEEIP